MKTPYLDRRTTAAIKGIALILMFVHHFFTFPEYYISGISYPTLEPLVRFLQTPTRLCVGIFAFLTGYFYHFSREQSLRYSLRKIRDFLISYWIVYAILLLLALALGCWKFSAGSFVRGLVGLDNTLMIFCWYVYFYILAMLILPVLIKLSTDKLTGDGVVLLALPVLAVTGIMEIVRVELGMESGAMVKILAAVREWLPVVISGYLCAKYALFEGYFDGMLQHVRIGWTRTILCLILCSAAFFGRLMCPRLSLGSIQIAGSWIDLVFSMDILYAPLFVYGLSTVLRSVDVSVIRRPLEAVGRRSMLMWFLHCVFFNCSKEYTQPVLYFLKNPLLVLLFGLAICYLTAVLIDLPLKKLLKRKKAAI